jgi:GNAT superfamily N-acetyltransferase
MAEVTLSAMSEDEFPEFVETTVREYAKENVQAGYWSPQGSLERSRREVERLLPQGVGTEGHHLYTVRDVASREGVGHLWLRAEEGPGGGAGFVFAVYLRPEHRGQGFGSATMRALDLEADRLGMRSLALHVFSSNGVAVHLYQSSGYCTKSMNMVKSLDDRAGSPEQEEDDQ